MPSGLVMQSCARILRGRTTNYFSLTRYLAQGGICAVIAKLLTVRVVWATRHHWTPRQQWRHPPSAYALWFVLNGTVAIFSQHQQWHLNAGDAFLFPPHRERLIITPNGAEWLSVGLEAQFGEKVDFLAHFPLPVAWQPKNEDRQKLQIWMEQIIHLFPPKTDVAHIIVSGLAQAIVGLCWQMLLGTDWSIPSKLLLPRWLSAVLHRLHENPKVTVAELVQLAHFSPAQFRRLFRTWMGVSPRAYLNRYRLTLSKRLLELTDLPVAHIADQCGFDSASYFSRTFKKAFGIAPSLYRLRLKEANTVNEKKERKGQKYER